MITDRLATFSHDLTEALLEEGASHHCEGGCAPHCHHETCRQMLAWVSRREPHPTTEGRCPVHPETTKEKS